MVKYKLDGDFLIKELLKKYKGIISYLFFGVLTTAVNVAVYYLCYEILGLPNIPSTVIAWVVAVAFAFVTNKAFVFDSRSWAAKTVVREAASFTACRIATGLIELLMMFFFVDLMLFNGIVMKLITNIVVIILNYIFSKLIIFKQKKETK